MGDSLVEVGCFATRRLRKEERERRKEKQGESKKRCLLGRRSTLPLWASTFKVSLVPCQAPLEKGDGLMPSQGNSGVAVKDG